MLPDSFLKLCVMKKKIIRFLAALLLAGFTFAATPDNAKERWVVDQVQDWQLGEDLIWHKVGEPYAPPDSTNKVGTLIHVVRLKAVKQ